MLLRIGLETAASLGVITEDRKYRTANYEVETRTGKFDRLAFEEVVKRAGELGARIESTWGQLSNIGPHSTPKRMKYASYDLGGEHFDRFGFAMDKESASAELALSLFPDVCLHLLDCFEKAYAQDSVEFPFADRLENLRLRFAGIRGTITRILSRNAKLS